MDTVEAFGKIITDKSMSWIVFKNGTCVMLEPAKDVKEQAIKILSKHGPIIAGTPAGDFEVTRIPEVNGWVVTGDYQGIMMYVSAKEAKSKSEAEIGLIGRAKRDMDAKSLEIAYIKE